MRVDAAFVTGHQCIFLHVLSRFAGQRSVVEKRTTIKNLCQFNNMRLFCSFGGVAIVLCA